MQNPWIVPCLVLMASSANAAEPSLEAELARVLDDWHLAASQADETRYFSHLAPNGVFLGTDATERWNRDEFQVWAHPIFAKGRAWNFKATRRFLTVSPEGKHAWFDEILDTPNLGPARGSGVLVKVKGRWLIAQYNLSVPIPNALMSTVKKQIEEHLKVPKPGQNP